MTMNNQYNPIQNQSVPLTDLVIPTKGLKGRVIVIRSDRPNGFGAHKLFTGLDCLSYAHVFPTFQPQFLNHYYRMQKKPSDGLYLKIRSEKRLPNVKEFIKEVSDWVVEKNMWAVVQLDMSMDQDSYDYSMYADIAIDLDPENELNGILVKNRLAYKENESCQVTNTGK